MSKLMVLADASLSGDLNQLTSSMTGIFSTVKSAGITIVTAAIGVGVIFVGAKWLWGKTRQWMGTV